jgi:hypothetical protein
MHDGMLSILCLSISAQVESNKRVFRSLSINVLNLFLGFLINYTN